MRRSNPMPIRLELLRVSGKLTEIELLRKIRVLDGQNRGSGNLKLIELKT